MFTGKNRGDYPTHFIDHRLRVGKSPVHGNGVFAVEFIPKRTLIEGAPVLEFHKDTYEKLAGTSVKDILAGKEYDRHVLMDYAFDFGAPGQVRRGDCMAIVFGWGSIYNHSSYESNVRWISNPELGCMDYYTTKDVEPGQELFVKYLPLRSADGLWFPDEAMSKHLDASRAPQDSFRDPIASLKNENRKR
jgi:SET domain-containing protein